MVTVFTQPDCLPCKRVLAKLEEAGIPVEVIDLSKDRVSKDYVTNFLGARSTPVIEAPGFDAILGYQPDRLRELITALKLDIEQIHDYIYEGEEAE